MVSLKTFRTNHQNCIILEEFHQIAGRPKDMFTTQEKKCYHFNEINGVWAPRSPSVISVHGDTFPQDDEIFNFE